MTRVLHYGLSSNLGGIETYLWNLSRTIDRGVYHFDFLYSDTGRAPALSTELTAMGSEFHGVTPRRVSPSRNKRELAELIRPERFDILHFHANTASYVEPVRAALRSGVKVIVHSHNAGTSRAPVTQVLHRVNSRALPWRRVTMVAVSDEAGRWMFGRAGTVEVIPNGIDIDAFRFDARSRELSRDSLGLGSDDFVVGNVGAFLPAKNHQFILDVFAQVLRRRPEAVLLLVGTGPLEAGVKARVGELGLERRVRFLGRRDDVPALLSAMDCLLFPSRYEGFGLVVLEAQSAGLHSVVSEAVPATVVVLPSAHRLPLHAGHASWADATLQRMSVYDRGAAADQVRAAGFSLGWNTTRVERLYDRVMQP